MIYIGTEFQITFHPNNFVPSAIIQIGTRTHSAALINTSN